MCTPIGHALAGTSIFYLVSGASSAKKWITFVSALFFAELPDIDFLFGFVVGNPDKYHHHFTHSLFFVALIGIISASIAAKTDFMNFKRAAIFFIGAGISHIILDILCNDTSAPFGIPLFWPFSAKYYISPILIFSDVHRISNSNIFFPSLINWHNLKTILIEIVILGPVSIYLFYRGKYRRITLARECH